MKTNSAIATVILIVINGAFAYSADSVDENALFNDSSSVVDSAKVVNAAPIKDDSQKKSVGFSGALTSAAIVSAARDWFSDFKANPAQLATGMVGNIYLDIRQPMGLKGFADLETDLNGNTTAVDLREIFIDANFFKRVYLRTGKQVLQWGRCYFWNPTDLINIEKKSFTPKIGDREGTYGVKLHIPFGTKANIYGFLDTRDATALNQCAGAGKFEYLFGGTEMAVALWDKQGAYPVFGYDISSQVFNIDISGEVAVSHGNNNYTLADNNGLLTIEKTGVWMERACVGLSRQFDFLDVKNRLSLTNEFYYNGAGYENNVFEDTLEKSFFLLNNLYEMHSYSKYYDALFFTFSKFILADMTYMFNTMFNIPQKSAQISTGVSYATLNSFSFAFYLIGNLGPKNTEYTYSGNAVTLQITAGLTF